MCVGIGLHCGSIMALSGENTFRKSVITTGSNASATDKSTDVDGRHLVTCEENLNMRYEYAKYNNRANINLRGLLATCLLPRIGRYNFAHVTDGEVFILAD